MKRILVATAIAALLAACNTTKPKPEEPVNEEIRAGAATGQSKIELNKEQALRDRAVNRWKLIIGGDFNKAFDYLTPGYRETRDRKEYVEVMSQRPIRWTNANFFDEVCQSIDACSVKIQLDFSIEMPVSGVGKVDSTSIVEEKWLRLDGVWYMLPEAKGQ